MASISNIHQSPGQATDSHRGLTADQAHRRFLEYGPNAISYLAALDFFKVLILRKFRYAGESL
jgi:Cation transporter/ATPase, N-terminus